MKLSSLNFRLLSGLSLLVFILIQASCTIEKRHFNNGYSLSWRQTGVQWKKSFKQVPDNKTTIDLAQKDPEKEEIIRDAEEPGAVVTTSTKVQTIESQSPAITENSGTKTVANKNQSQPEARAAVVKIIEKKETTFQKVKEKVSKTQMQRKERGNIGKGIFMFVYALLFLLLALLFSTLGTVGSVFALIFSIAAGILVIFGIIFIIVGLVQG